MNQSLRSSQIVIAYSRNMEIRKRVFEFEEGLNEKFITPFRTVAIPDELDPSIPRFESQSIHSHSKLQVSQNRINIATNFDGKLSNEQIKDYLIEKRESISRLADVENINFIAYILDLNFFLPKENINNFIKKNTGTIAITDDNRDFTLLYSRVFKEKYYLNITCSKFEEQEVKLVHKGKDTNQTNVIRNGISVKVDLNTKFFFEKNGKFNDSLYSSLETIVFDLINEKSLSDYLNGNI